MVRRRERRHFVTINCVVEEKVLDLVGNLRKRTTVDHNISLKPRGAGKM
jgi:hypothetical protein